MKKFWELSKKPIIVGLIASILYICDALIAGLFVKGGTFMWVAFVFWTIFFGATLKDRIKALIGTIIGFFAGVLMMLITSSFTLNISSISISCLLGVLLINTLVMYFEKTEKVWLNSISGIFAGIFLTFSGLGVSLNPLASFKEGALMLSIILVYAVLGLLCGFFTLLLTKTKKQENPVDKKMDKTNEK